MNLYSNIMKSLNATNISIDYADGCFSSYNKIACTRDGVEAVAAVVTAIFCVIKVVKLHVARHELWNQYLIFYSAIVEIILLTLNWLYLQLDAVNLVAELLKLFQFIVVCRFYCEVASRMARTEHLYKRLFLPLLAATGIYFVVLILVGIVDMKESPEECAELVWIQLSGSEVALGIVSIFVGIYITRKTNKLKTDSSYKRNIRLSLWGIILSYQLSSLISMAYDFLMLKFGKENRCKGVFLRDAAAFTASHLLVKVFKWLLPIWAMIIIYKPESFRGGNTQAENSEHPPIVQRSSVGVFKSEFRPRGKSFNYKHLRDPDNEDERDILTGGNVENYPDLKVKKKKRRNRSGGSASISPNSQGSKKSPSSKAVVVGINSDPVSAAAGRDPVV